MAAIMEVTDKTFESEVLSSDKVILVDFWAPWCMPCQKQTPILEQLQEMIKTDESVKDKVKIVKINTEENHEMAQKYNIGSIPSLLIFKEAKVVKQMVGLHDAKALMDNLVKES